MNQQHTRRRRTRCAVVRVLAVGAAAAALAAVLGAGQALAGVAPPDERVLERQGRIDNQAAANQADEQAKARESSQKATEIPRRWIRPEPPVHTGPRLDPDEQVAPTPPPPVPDDAGPGLTAPAILAALILALATITTWRIRRHGRPRPRPDATS
jgi:uncharacterized protein HemX